jgi:hypothetical protein
LVQKRTASVVMSAQKRTAAVVILVQELEFVDNGYRGRIRRRRRGSCT